MPTPPLSKEKARDAVEAVKRYGSISAAANGLGIARQTLHSRIKKEAAFAVLSDIPSRNRSVEEIIAHRIAEGDRAVAFEEGLSNVTVEVKTPGPVGLLIFGDPHIDSPGMHFRLFHEHLKLAAARPDYVLCGNIGDVRDNWIGRLTRLYAHQTITARESWKLTEWVFKGSGVEWAFLIRGNHDCWSGDNDPLDWISADSGVGIDLAHGVRIRFLHHGGIETRLHARHDFPGNSMWNPLHALKRETAHGYRDHIIVAGHRHEGADAGDCIAGLSFQMVRLSGYKVSDDYVRQGGFQRRPHHPAALIIVDPDEPDHSRARAWCCPTVERGIEILDDMRRRYNDVRRNQDLRQAKKGRGMARS